MKLFKYTLMALALAGAMVSCSDDDDYTVAPQSAGAYFPNTNASSYRLTLDGSTFSVPVMRTDASGAATYNITSSADAQYFTVPSTVSFVDGQNSADLIIAYDADALGYDNSQSISLSLAEADANQYGKYTYSFTAIIPSPWTSLGMATMTEDFLTTFFAIDPTTYQVEIQENDLTPGYYRLVNPLTTPNYPYYSPGDEEDPDGTGYIYLDASNPDEVFMPISDTNCNWTYGLISLMSFNYYYMQKGMDTDPSLWGTLADGIISFPKESCLIQMIDYSTGWYPSNVNGAFKVYMPGVPVKDYATAIEYSGLFMDANTQGYSAVMNVSVGSDVESAKVGMMLTRSETDVLEAMEAGGIDTYDFAAGENQTAYIPLAEAGYYTAVIVAYDGDEEVGSSSVTFKVDLGSEPELSWSYVATGTYTYANYWEGDDEGLELYVCDTDASLYKIEHWGNDVDFFFNWADDGTVTVQDQFTGVVNSSYGDVWVMELGEYVGNTDYGWSSYENGVFTFNTVWYVSAGVFGYGPETFTITATSQSAPAKVQGKANVIGKNNNVKFHINKAGRDFRPVLSESISMKKF